MMTLFRPILLTAMLLLPAVAMTDNGNIGIVPLIKSGNETLLFVDADNGELASFSVLDEPVAHAVVTEDGRFYAQTRHYLYEGSVSTGEVMKRVQTMEIIAQEEGEAVDPNQTILPLGVSRSGKALFSYNGESRKLQLRNAELVKQMQGAPLATIQSISKEVQANNAKLTPIMMKQPVFMADMEGKVSHLKDFDFNTERVVLFDKDEVIHTFSLTSHILRSINLEGNPLNEIDPGGVFSGIPELRGTVAGLPQIVAPNLVYYTFGGSGGSVTSLIYDVALGQVLQVKPVAMGFASVYPLSHENSPTYVYGDKECSAGPMPTLPDFGKPAGTSKKAMAEWQESLARKQTEHSKALEEWSKNATNPDTCTVSIYRDPEMKDKLVEIENTAIVTIYNDRYALARRSMEVVMYDLMSREQLWAVDTDF